MNPRTQKEIEKKNSLLSLINLFMTDEGKKPSSLNS
jgi:hypothetical protein